MKLIQLSTVSIAAATMFALTACSHDTATEATTSSAMESSSAATAPLSLPNVEELNAILAMAADPNVPIEERTQTVQNGESAPELFETMARSKQESGADFQVVQPILPGYTPDSVLATVNFTLPDRESQPAENVEFVFENGRWKLSQSWACTLITNTVAPEQVPPMCTGTGDAPMPVPEPPLEEQAPEEAIEQMPADAPVEEVAPEEAPQE